MSDLGEDAKALIARTRSGDDPTADDAARMRAKVFAGIVAAGAATATTGAAGAATATTGAAGAATATTGAAAAVQGAAGGSTAAAGAIGSSGLATAGLSLSGKVTAALLIAATSAGGIGAYRVATRSPAVVQTQPALAGATTAMAPAAPVAMATTPPPSEDPRPTWVEEARPRPLPSAPPPRVSPAERAPTRVHSTSTAIPDPDPAPAAGITGASESAVVARDEAARPAPSGARVQQELALLRDAHLAHDGGDPARALALLAEHAQRFPRSAFEEERAALRIFSLCRMGRTSEGVAEASQFETQWPESRLVGRVRRACR